MSRNSRRSSSETSKTKSPRLPKLEAMTPLPDFIVETRLRYGIRGRTVVVHVTEKMPGTTEVFLTATSFAVDVASLPEVLDALSLAFHKAMRLEKRDNRRSAKSTRVSS